MCSPGLQPRATFAIQSFIRAVGNEYAVSQAILGLMAICNDHIKRDRPMDEVARANEQVWEGLVKEGDCGYTIPWLDLKREEILK